jgi:flavin-binding protein dodecin
VGAVRHRDEGLDRLDAMRDRLDQRQEGQVEEEGLVLGVVGDVDDLVRVQARVEMAKKAAESGVYRVTEIIGTSPTSWEDAARTAVETAAATLRDLRVAEVNKLDLKIEGGKVVAFRAKVSLSFKYEG